MVQSLLAGLGALIAYVFLFVTFGIRLLLPTPYLLKSIDVSDGVSYISNSPWGSGSDRGPAGYRAASLRRRVFLDVQKITASVNAGTGRLLRP
jgi:hypothetical protein